jgi:nucleotide-binding universal stress UspA family protein
MRLLLAVDGSPCSDAAVQTVTERFHPQDTQVKVLHAVEWMREMPLCFQYGQGRAAAADVVDRRNQSFERARDLVEGISAQLEFKGFHPSVSTPDADPRHAIVDAAREWSADLILMGSHSRRGLDRLLLGSVAESVVRHAPCSVEIVRAPGSARAPETLHTRTLRQERFDEVDEGVHVGQVRHESQ